MSVEDQIRARVAELTAEREAIMGKLVPLQDERDALLAEYAPRERELARQIKELRGPLFEIDQERARLLRALPGTVSMKAEGSAS